jgi:CHAT domain-containing protein
MSRIFIFLFVICSVFLTVSAQVTTEPITLIPGQSVDREIAGAESHTYQISLTTGQFVRFRLEQRALDAALILSAPDGKKLIEMNLTRAGDQESLSLEAATAGIYRLTVRGIGVATLHGSYRLEAAVQAIATAPDRMRLTAEALLLEANQLSKQAGKTAPQVIEKSEQALLLWKELSEPRWSALSLRMIGTAYYDLSQFEKALVYHEQAVTTYREVKDRVGEAVALNSMGYAYSNLSRNEKAIECFDKALASFRELKDLGGAGDSLNSLGIVYRLLSQYEKAIESLEQALAISHELGDRRREGNALHALAQVNYWLSRYEKMIECLEQALAIYREDHDKSREGTSLGNLGIAYYALGRYEKAIEYHEQLLAISREQKDRMREAAACNNLGLTYHALGRYEKAIEFAEQALAIFREIKNRNGEGKTLGTLGAAYQAQGRYEKAIQSLEQNLAISREIGDHEDEGGTLASLGSTHGLLGRYDKAIEYYEQSLTIARGTKDQANEGEALKGLAIVEWKRGNLAQARTHIERSLRIAESLRSDLINPESRASFLASVHSSYQFYTDLLMRQHQAEPTKGFDALAVEVSERQRARSLLDLLNEAHADVRQGVDTALLERERLLGRQLNGKAQQLAQANNPQQAAALKQEISQLETAYERAQASIRKSSPHYAALVQPQPLKLKEIQAQLDADTLLLEYALGEERSYLWAITRDSLTSYELPNEEVIKKSALQVYEMLTARSTSKRGESTPQRQERIAQTEAKLPAAAQQLSQMLLAPVASEIGNRRLVIVADGALQYIPFAMLPDPSVVSDQLSVAKSNGPRTNNNGQPLIVRHEVVSLPSASALTIQRTELAGRQPAPKLLAVIADPVFDRTDVRFTKPTTEASEKTQPQTIGINDARSIEHLAENSADKLGVTTLRLVIPRLLFTRQEANQLIALTPKGSSFSATDFQASRATVLDPALGQYRYVHFATHGFLDSERPGLSALVFSMVDAQGKPQDGFLRANDIYNLKLPAELVVLSACQTGLGKEIKGEGLVGLTRGFMYAGAARVVVSLWNVNDKATADLMTKFYEKMLKQGERPAAALRAAQVEMWKQKQWQSPYYWAAFTMQGEWR